MDTLRLPIVYFDGVCGLCNGSVDFLLRRDRAQVLCFTPLQGDIARERLGPQAQGDPDSFVLEDADGIWRRSDAALRIARHLGGAWRCLGVLRVIPRPVRDALYDFVARNRYRWFGRKETCRLPAPDERSRFLP
jgi:predicted DCC family thiol-disulfide oxidoreductase YuxK